MKEKRYSSGEIAAIAGLTIRTVQHYDNIGLLPSSGRTQGGRRYYTQDDLIQIEQIVLYKLLGFSLEQIKEELLLNPKKTELLDMFENQQLMLLQKIEHLHTSFATIGIISEMVKADKEPPFSILLRFLSSLPGDDIFSKAPQMISEKQQMFSNYFQDIESVQVFYHKWKEIMIESSILFHEGISPSSIAAQDMAKRWWETILSFTNGDTELIRQLSELDIETQLTRNDKDMMNSVSQFLEDSLEIYTIQNNVQKEEDNDDTPDEFNKKI